MHTLRNTSRPGLSRTLGNTRRSLSQQPEFLPESVTTVGSGQQPLADSTKISEPVLPASYRAWGTPDYMRDVWDAWHKTTVPLPDAWSHEWGLWDHTDSLFGPSADDSLSFQQWITHLLGIPATTIEPLAFRAPNTPDPMFVFAAEGRYYYFEGTRGKFWAYEGVFAVHDVFFARHVGHPHWPICGEVKVVPWGPEDDAEEEECREFVEEYYRLERELRAKQEMD
ncbi:hypothetical protein C8R46DRAFT_1228950 [Mycena filopes]|nr:hypothetical protein C8R46DRAFT_1228950 [Mycena filopes]